MRFGLVALVALIVGAFGAHFLLQDRGYVLVSFRGWTVEMSVPILLLALVAFYLAVRLLRRLWRAPRDLGAAIAEHRHRRAAGRLTRGLIHMTEGDWTRGERLLTDGVARGDAPLVNYLMAARAAHLQGSRERRNEWLRLAFDSTPEAETTVLLTQAELQFEDGEHEHALATVRRVLGKDPANSAAMALLAEVLIAVGDREQLVELLPKLKKAKLQMERLTEIADAALTALLGRPELREEGLSAVWSSLPAEVKRQPRVARLYAQGLDRLGRGDDAAKALVADLKKSWNEDLVRAYGEVTASDRSKQLARAETWLRERPDDPALLLTAGRLCLANELWGKARSYLESSIALRPDPTAYSLYGQLLDRLGEREQAAQAYHSGLSLVSGVDVSQPALEARPKSMAG